MPVAVEAGVNLVNSKGSNFATGTAGGATVNFLSNVEIDAASGAATIKPSDNGGLINSLTVTVPGYEFEDLICGASLASLGSTEL